MNLVMEKLYILVLVGEGVIIVIGFNESFFCIVIEGGFYCWVEIELVFKLVFWKNIFELMVLCLVNEFELSFFMGVKEIWGCIIFCNIYFLVLFVIYSGVICRVVCVCILFNF